MCGIVGYIGNKPADYIILNALKKLEYRGYDSAGIALLQKNGDIFLAKQEGKILNLENLVLKERNGISSFIGIGHTRWATHGEPNESNAHPHTDCNNEIAVVHNGIIENFWDLKNELINKGHKFTSFTDTETIPHLIEENLQEFGNLKDAIFETIKKLNGAYALSIIYKKSPNMLIGVRKGSPLVLGVGDGEYFLASDIPAFLEYTKDVVFLEDNDVVIIHDNKFEIYNNGEQINRKIHKITWDASQAEKGGYKHFMLKEIMEQPEAVQNTFLDKIDIEKHTLKFKLNKEIDKLLDQNVKIIITACGTSWHAGLIGKFMIEALSGFDVEVDYASELRYRLKSIDKNTLLIAVSQSGETADTLEVIKRFKDEGAKVLSVCNVLGSSISRDSHQTLFTHAGPEISVASTKAFTSQIVIFYLLALYLGVKRKKIFQNDLKKYIEDLIILPKFIERTLELSNSIKDIAPTMSKFNNYLYLGRGINYPVAMEGALKLKEISYIHAEGYPGGEMKHGPLALIDENMPTVIVLPNDRLFDKMIGNLSEIKSRRGKTVIVTNNSSNSTIKELADLIFAVPFLNEYLQTILNIIPLQFFSYYIADFKGCDIDQPRNLAKSVTVE